MGIIEVVTTYTQSELDAAILAERRRCADICNELGMQKPSYKDYENNYEDGYLDATNECQWAILETPDK